MPSPLAMLALGLAGLVSVATLWVTRHGPELTHDSITYISVARNLADGAGIVDFTGRTLTVFPPGFPTVLAFGEALGIAATTAARWVNVCGYAAIVLLSCCLLRRLVATAWVVGAGTAIIAFSSQLLDIAGTVWSDTVFIALIITFLLVLDRAARRPEDGIRWTVGAALLVWPTFLVRYVGLSLIASGALALWLMSIRQGVRTAVRRTATFIAVAAAVPALWILRNLLAVAEDPMGVRVTVDDGPLQLFDQLGSAFVRASALSQTPTGLRFVGALGIAAAFLAWALVSVRARREAPVPVGVQRSSPVPVVLFVVIYLSFVLTSRKLAGPGIDRRILAPAVVGIIVLAARALDTALLHLGGRSGVARIMKLASIAFVLMAGLAYGYRAWDGDRGRARSHNLDHGRIERMVARLDSDARVVSNEPWRLYAAVGREPVGFSPGFAQAEMSHRPPRLDAFARSLCDHAPTYLVWYRDVRPPYLVGRGALRRNVRLVAETMTHDGVLYRVESIADCKR